MIDYSEALIKMQQLTKQLESDFRKNKTEDALETLTEIKCQHDKLRNWCWHNGR